MISKKVIIIALVIIVIFAITIFITIRNGILWQKEGLNTNLKIGKELYITIEDNNIIDAEYLSKVADGTNDSALSLWDSEELPKLINYMKKNNFIIEPGKYTINQAWPFEKVREVLRFRKR